MNIQGFIERLEEKRKLLLGYPRFLADFVGRTDIGVVLIALVQDQMLKGRDGDGNVLTPGYLQDPYFKSPEEAAWYKHRKDELLPWHNSLISEDVPWPEKSDNTPNLIWSGPFQQGMFISYNAEAFRIGSKYDDARDIEDKYNNNLFKLAPLSKQYFWEFYLLEASLRYFGHI